MRVDCMAFQMRSKTQWQSAEIFFAIGFTKDIRIGGKPRGSTPRSFSQ